MDHVKHPHTFAYPEHAGHWEECDGCCDELPALELATIAGWKLCPECLAFYATLKPGLSTKSEIGEPA